MTDRTLNPEEQRAWARVARSIKPLDGVADAALMEDAMRAMLSPPRASPRHTPPRTAAKPPALPVSRQPKVSDRGNERRVRKGQTSIAAQFDLHGHTQESAASALPQFLERHRASGARCVLIITGKGEHGEGVLRRNFLHWMGSPTALGLASGYAEAHRKHGGSGAFYVFLRRR